MHERHSTSRAGLGLALALVICGGCDSDSSSRRSLAPSPLPPTAPSPPPAPAPPVAPHRVVVSYEPDWDGSPAPRDSDGSYLLDWGGAWYCVWLDNIPSTLPDRCRDYPFTFSWLPSTVSLPELWTGPLWSRGCRSYPHQINPGPCFQTPARDSVSARQSITIVGMERVPNGTPTEMFRTELALRFRDR